MTGTPIMMYAPPLLQSTDVLRLGEAVSHPFVAELLPIALLSAGFIVILYYLLGKFLGSPQIDAFAKEELSQWMISVFIAASWFAVYAATSGIVSAAICGGESCSLVTLAFYSLDSVFYEILSAYVGFLSLEIFIGVLSSIGFSLSMGTPILAVKWLSFSPYGGMAMLSNAVVSIIESIGMLVGLVVGRQQLLEFLFDITPGFLLPLGLFLRSLPFTRTTGSSLIAISFAGFFIFPASILFSHYLMFGPQAHPAYIPIAPTPLGICEPEGADINESLFYLNQSNAEIREQLSTDLSNPLPYESNWYQVSGLIGSAQGLLGGLLSDLWEFVGGKVSLHTFIDIIKPTTFAYFFYFMVLERFQGLAQISVMIAVTFVIEIIITITGYRAIAAALGGELEILGLTKVV
ncbi:hypothetical protein GF412_04460 [Candidatus Micrarchaeota archaeon]|nr:hypothetical protein [Candidatus Micrarchaeota archaeon]MBD3418204.1 hypothetical protein [Candidatus Micrarchaeota archaeon]